MRGKGDRKRDAEDAEGATHGAEGGDLVGGMEQAKHVQRRGTAKEKEAATTTCVVQEHYIVYKACPGSTVECFTYPDIYA